jgi:hypothetical protein
MLANLNPNTILTESGAPAPDNSELRKIAEDILARAKASFTAVASYPNQTVHPDSLEAAFQAGLAQMPAAKRERLCRRAGQMAQACPAVREMLLGRYGQLSSQEFLSRGFEQAGEGLRPLPINAKLLGVKPRAITLPSSAFKVTAEGLLVPLSQLPGDFKGIQADWEERIRQAIESGVANPNRLAEIWGMDTAQADETDVAGIQAATNTLNFNISRIKCVDETSPEWPGSDEIALAGVSVDETGDTKKIPETYIGGGFDDGDQKLYRPAWRYHNFSLLEGQVWPKTYLVSLIPAEKDHGGLSKVLDKAWEAIGKQVKQEIEKAVAGVLKPALGPVIAAAIGKVAAWIVGQLAGWLIGGLQDDIFPPYTARVTLPSATARWNYPNGQWGSPTSPLQQAHFYGHGGHYLLEYYWELSA